jgi:hypothetical protein
MFMVDGTLQVIGLVALAGAFVMEHESLTTPAKLPEGDAVIVAVFPVAAPALIEIAPASSVKVAFVRVTVPLPADPR